MRAWLMILGVIGIWMVGRLLSTEFGALRPVMDAVLAVTVLLTALRFERGDPPRWAWGAAAFAQILATLVHLAQDGHLGAGAMPWIDPATVVLNLAWIAVIVIFARNLASSGLAPPWNGRHVAFVTVALLLAGLGLGLVLHHEWANLRAQGLGWSDESSNAVSTLADAAVFVGAVFLARMVAPMAGGRVARPYLLLCFSGAAYLVVDVIVASGGTRVYSALDVGAQLWVALADGALMAAALAQIELVREDG